MKSYSQGLITGGVLVFAIIVFMSASSKDLGRYQPCDASFVLDTQTGTVYWEGKIRAKISEEVAFNDDDFLKGMVYEEEDDG